MLDRVETVDDLERSPFGPAVAYCVRRADRPLDYQMHADEAAALTARAVEKRRLEFRLGRAAAHHALRALLGVTPGPVRRGATREPLWPDGVVGAITHAGPLAAAAVARRRDCAGLGLDVEERGRPIGADIGRLVGTPAELEWVRADSTPSDLRLRLLFSAKESVFKALYPVESVYLGFHDAELSWDDRGSAFDAVLRKAAGRAWPVGSRLRVGCRIAPQQVQTWVQLAPAG